MDADVRRISEEMKDLEQHWFAAHHAALTAHLELEAIDHGDAEARRAVNARLAQAERDKVLIMRRIEALEDALVG